MSQRLTLAPGVRAALIAHAERELPREAVGLLAGTDRCATMVCQLTNLAGDHAFLADPRTQYEAERRIARHGLSLLAIYHSHPAGSATMSELDVRFSRRRDVLHVVIALARPWHEGAELRAYALEAGHPTELPLEG